MEFIAESLRTVLKMGKASLNGMMDHFTKVIFERINAMEKDFLSRTKEVLKENGEMMKLTVQDI